MPNSSTTQKEEQDRATADLAHIAQLNNSVAFQQYFLRRLRDKIAPLEADILSGHLAHEHYIALVSEYRALREVERMLEDDAAGARSVLGLSKEEMPCT
jgi:hypothetical protein